MRSLSTTLFVLSKCFIQVFTLDLFQDVLNYAFPYTCCVQVLFSKRVCSDHAFMSLHSSSISASFQLGEVPLSGCPYEIYLATHLLDLKELLEETRGRKKKRFLCVVHNDTAANLRALFNTSVFLPDVNGLVYIASIPNTLFEYSTVWNRLEKLNVRSLKEGVENPLNGKKLKVATFNCSIYSKLSPYGKDGKLRGVDGIELTFLKTMSHHLNFTYELLEPSSSANMWGIYLGNGTFDGGVIGLAVDGKVDLSFCGIWYSFAFSSTQVDVTTHTSISCVKFLVPRPHVVSSQWDGIFLSFTLDVWAFTFLTLALFSITLYWIATTEVAKGPCGPNGTWAIRCSSLLECVFCTFAVFLNSDQPVMRCSTSKFRYNFLGTSAASLLLMTAFSSSLFSQLTNRHLGRKVNTIEDAIKEGFHWFSTHPCSMESYLDFELDTHRQWSKRHRLASSEDILKMSSNSTKMLIIGEQNGKTFQTLDGAGHLHLDRFEASDVCLKKFSEVFLLQFASPYKRVFNKQISRYREAGLFEKGLEDIGRKTSTETPYTRKVLILTKPNRVEKPLNIYNLLGVFALWASGIVLSTVAFVVEIISW